jgi:hypothetical protein
LGEIAEFLESKAVAKKIVEDRKKLPDGFLDEEARRLGTRSLREANI